MTCVIQRVFSAAVTADGVSRGAIGRGLYLLLGVMRGDEESDALLLAEKISKLRIFTDEAGKMNLSVNDIGGEVMVVSNFTLGASYAHGNRPDFLSSEEPGRAKELYDRFVTFIGERVKRVATGEFGADMRTDLVTDGPVTIVMRSEILKSGGKQK